MKKHFVFAIIIAFIFSACGGNSIANLPDGIREFVEKENTEIETDFDAEGFRYDGIIVEGNNLVCINTIDESNSGYGTPISNIFDLSKASEAKMPIMQAMIKAQGEEYAEYIFKLLREHQYNIVYRYVGSITKQKIDLCTFYWEELYVAAWIDTEEYQSRNIEILDFNHQPHKTDFYYSNDYSMVSPYQQAIFKTNCYYYSMFRNGCEIPQNESMNHRLRPSVDGCDYTYWNVTENGYSGGSRPLEEFLTSEECLPKAEQYMKALDYARKYLSPDEQKMVNLYERSAKGIGRLESFVGDTLHKYLVKSEFETNAEYEARTTKDILTAKFINACEEAYDFYSRYNYCAGPRDCYNFEQYIIPLSYNAESGIYRIVYFGSNYSYIKYELSPMTYDYRVLDIKMDKETAFDLKSMYKGIYSISNEKIYKKGELGIDEKGHRVPYVDKFHFGSHVITLNLLKKSPSTDVIINFDSIMYDTGIKTRENLIREIPVYDYVDCEKMKGIAYNLTTQKLIDSSTH